MTIKKTDFETYMKNLPASTLPLAAQKALGDAFDKMPAKFKIDDLINEVAVAAPTMTAAISRVVLNFETAKTTQKAAAKPVTAEAPRKGSAGELQRAPRRAGDLSGW